MKCHFVYDEIAGKVLIPGCWGSLHRNDKSCCTCHIPDASDTWNEFEKKCYNIRVKELKSEIIGLHEVIKNLESSLHKQNRIIEKLKTTQ